MTRKKKLVNHIVKEYWDKPCPICGSNTPPSIRYSEEGYKQKVLLCCPECDLTLSFRKPKVSNLPEINEPVRSLDFKPNILNSVY